MNAISVTRTVAVKGVVVTESASAPMPDDLTLDDLTEALRREMIAAALFNSLPSVQARHQAQNTPPPCPPKPPSNPSRN